MGQQHPGSEDVVSVAAKGSGLEVSDGVVRQWAESVWIPAVMSASSEKSSALVVDGYAPHAAESVRSVLAAAGTRLVVIPAACSPRLQPLHRSIKQEFLVMLC